MKETTKAVALSYDKGRATRPPEPPADRALPRSMAAPRDASPYPAMWERCEEDVDGILREGSGKKDGGVLEF